MRRQDKVRQLIEERLRELHVTRKALARALGVSASAITRKMKGETPFTDDEVKKVSAFLRIPDLFDYPTLDVDMVPAYNTYDPGLKILHDALVQLPLREKNEMYFILAVLIEGKLPQTNFGPILRALAGQS